MRNRFRSISIQGTVLLVLAGCLTPFDVVTENKGGRIVISGQLNTLDEAQTVEVGVTSNKYRKPFPVIEAKVTLYDLADPGSPVLFYPATGKDGVYELNGFHGTPGRSYYLQVILKTGEVYQSRPEKIPATQPSLTTEFDFDTRSEIDIDGLPTHNSYLNVYSNSSITADRDSVYLKWDAVSTFIIVPTNFPDPFGVVPPPCFVTQKSDPQRITLAAIPPKSTTEFNRLLVGKRFINYSFITRHYITVYQSALTYSAYEYWRKANLLANRVGSIFDTPPAPLEGNLYNPNDPADKPLGYFQATNTAFSRFFLVRSDLPLLLQPEMMCDFKGWEFNYPGICLDCLSVSNSSYVAPEWF